MTKKVIGVAVLGLMLFGQMAVVGARQIGTFSNFTVTYSGAERFTGYLTKATTGRNGVVNLSNDTGTAWITANMKNSNGAFRGGTTVQRGRRAEFTTPNALAGYNDRYRYEKDQ